MPKNNFWFLLICLYLLIPSLFIPSYFFKIFNYFNLLCFSPVKRNNYSRPNNFLFSKQNLFFIFLCNFFIFLYNAQGVYPYGVTPQEGKGTGVCLYGGILPVAVFILFNFQGGTGVYLYGGKNYNLVPPCVVSP